MKRYFITQHLPVKNRPKRQTQPVKSYFITQHFPVCRHVYKYLKKTYGTDHIKLSKTNHIDVIILNLQSKVNYKPVAKREKLKKVFSVDISENYFNRYGMHLHPNHAVIFNDIIDGMFRDEIYKSAIILKNKSENKILKSLREHLEMYDISEDDIKLDSLYRDFKRKRHYFEKITNT